MAYRILPRLLQCTTIGQQNIYFIQIKIFLALWWFFGGSCLFFVHPDVTLSSALNLIHNHPPAEQLVGFSLVVFAVLFGVFINALDIFFFFFWDSQAPGDAVAAGKRCLCGCSSLCMSFEPIRNSFQQPLHSLIMLLNKHKSNNNIYDLTDILFVSLFLFSSVCSSGRKFAFNFCAFFCIFSEEFNPESKVTDRADPCRSSTFKTTRSRQRREKQITRDKTKTKPNKKLGIISTLSVFRCGEVYGIYAFLL